MKRALAICLLLGAAAAVAMFGTGAGEDSSNQKFKIEFDNAFGLTKGGDLRVGGVRVGKTSSFDVTKAKNGRPLAIVEAEIDQPGVSELRRDAECEIKPQSLIGEYFVDCQPGSAKAPLGEGATIPVTNTASTIPLDAVQNILRAPYRERLRILLSELGTGLAGRSEDLREVLERADPGLRETNKTLKILADQNRQLASFVQNADAVIRPIEREKAEVVRWIRETRRAAEITATRREELRATLRRLPGFLDELEPTMNALGQLADRQRPLLTDIRAGAPALDTFLTRLAPFSTASLPALRALGDAGEAGVRAIADTREEVDVLRQLAALAPPTGTAPDQQGVVKPLRQFLTSLDDRRRAGDETPRSFARAAASDPPAPDPTNIPAGSSQGFTTMEDFWNYAFWQTLAINGYDGTGHILRVSGIISPCINFQVEPKTAANAALFDQCNQFLGPNQPGVTTPDPTRTSPISAPRSVLATDGQPASRRSEERSENEPAAGPVPGQPDRSRPDPEPPAGVNTLLDRLTAPLRRDSGAPRPAVGAAPASTGDASKLLDYLLGP